MSAANDSIERLEKDLTVVQEKMLAKMEAGKWYSAYDLQCSLATAGALTRKGYIEQRNHNTLGSFSMPRSTIEFKRKEKE